MNQNKHTHTKVKHPYYSASLMLEKAIGHKGKVMFFNANLRMTLSKKYTKDGS